MTTYLSLPGKMDQAICALGSLKNAHSAAEWRHIEAFIVVNESDPRDPAACRDLGARLRALYPWITLIQKDESLRGQAASLNLILEQLGGMDIWVHWEESWGCTRPFLSAGIEAMAQTAITQLQISTDIWSEAGGKRLRSAGRLGDEDILEVGQHPTFVELLPTLSLASLGDAWRAHGLEVIWPLYSLRPSVNRASFYTQLGRFSTDRSMWPWLFEWDFGMRWLKAGGVKGIFARDAAQRLPRHQSTHRLIAQRGG